MEQQKVQEIFRLVMPTSGTARLPVNDAILRINLKQGYFMDYIQSQSLKLLRLCILQYLISDNRS